LCLGQVSVDMELRADSVECRKGSGVFHKWISAGGDGEIVLGRVVSLAVLVVAVVALFFVYSFRYAPSIPNVQTVYDRYFAKYGFPPHMKNEITRELKLVINFIHYCKNSEKKDYVSLMRFLKEYSSRPFLTSMLQSEAEHGGGSAARAGQNERSERDRREYCQGFTVFLDAQKKLADRYSLPYRVPGASLSYIDIAESIHAKDFDTPDSEHPKSALSASRASRLKSIGWKNGDLLLAHRAEPGKGSSLQGYYNHIGIYDAECDCIIDAMPGGVRRSSWEFWIENFSDMARLRFDNLNEEKIEKAVDYARKHIGEPYSLLTYKENEKSGWYCSKLVYKAYKQAGLVLDIKGGVSILPDDIIIGADKVNIRCINMSSNKFIF